MADHLSAFVARAIPQAGGAVPILFVSGAQGIGKSTALQRVIDSAPHRIAGMSLDDFYLTRAERARLSESVHPLSGTRGPPGTHDVALLGQTLDALRHGSGGVPVPVFDKRRDDRLPTEEWRALPARPDAILVEGWMMGVLADFASLETPPLNAVEAAPGALAWRRWQEEQLAGPYAALWDRADAFCHFDAPGFDCVLRWRTEQEAQNQGVTLADLPEARKDWVRNFIAHYERLTRRMLSGGRREGAVVKVGVDRGVIGGSCPALRD
ncbi:MAG: hypothetical protein CMF04_13080 [Hyphomonas sp.]|nr:hypothetical protein [Hyphomonas sp.]